MVDFADLAHIVARNAKLEGMSGLERDVLAVQADNDYMSDAVQVYTASMVNLIRDNGDSIPNLKRVAQLIRETLDLQNDDDTLSNVEHGDVMAIGRRLLALIGKRAALMTRVKAAGRNVARRGRDRITDALGASGGIVLPLLGRLLSRKEAAPGVNMNSSRATLFGGIASGMGGASGLDANDAPFGEPSGDDTPSYSPSRSRGDRNNDGTSDALQSLLYTNREMLEELRAINVRGDLEKAARERAAEEAVQRGATMVSAANADTDGDSITSNAPGAPGVAGGIGKSVASGLVGSLLSRAGGLAKTAGSVIKSAATRVIPAITRTVVQAASTAIGGAAIPAMVGIGAWFTGAKIMADANVASKGMTEWQQRSRERSSREGGTPEERAARQADDERRAKLHAADDARVAQLRTQNTPGLPNVVSELPNLPTVDSTISAPEVLRAAESVTVRPNSRRSARSPKPVVAPTDSPTRTTTPSQTAENLIAVKNLHVSEDGIKRITTREGIATKAYWDVNGWAIGMGLHTYKGKPVVEGQQETKEDVIKESRAQIDGRYGDIIRKNLTVPVTQNQFDAMVSVAWNSEAAGKNLAKRVSAGKPITADYLRKSATVKGKENAHLVERRAGEFAQFNEHLNRPAVLNASVSGSAQIAPPRLVAASSNIAPNRNAQTFQNASLSTGSAGSVVNVAAPTTVVRGGNSTAQTIVLPQPIDPHSRYQGIDRARWAL